MAQPQPEKRNTRRFSLDLPISVKFLNNGKRELAGHTRDVSSRGVFIYLETEISAGAPIEFVMTLPPENHTGGSYSRALHRKDTQSGEGNAGSRRGCNN